MRYTASSYFLLLLSVWTGPGWCGGPQSIDPIALDQWLDDRDPPLMLDVRSRAEYLAGTVPGALDAGSNPDGFLPDSQGGVAVLVTTEATLLEAWHARLSAFGYQVHVLDGGLPAWRAAGLPVEQPEPGFVRPGTVPFVIPRGICEMNEPAEVFK
jgi:rhodanese-related sulfurtransferase